MTPVSKDSVEAAELGDLLCGLARSIVRAQDELDQHASRQATQYVQLPSGTLAMPPLWYTVKNAVVEVAMAGVLQSQQMICRLVNPAGVAMYGYEASSGVRVRISIGPSAVAPVEVKHDEPADQ